MARTMIDGLAQAVAQNRTALLALTTLKNYDNYTFTHMVNVSILTMAQARGLGIEGALLREFGLAALMHDIGKVRTPTEILNKPDKLTTEEFAIMKRHTLTAPRSCAGRRTCLRWRRSWRSNITCGSMAPAIPTRVAAHAQPRHDAVQHRRRVRRDAIAARLPAVVSDGAHPRSPQAERRQQFDQNLVRRFVQLLGIYPVGNLVRLNTGEIAVVRTRPRSDPYRPQVRILIGRDG